MPVGLYVAPAVPFVAGSFALGFFALGPYLFLREPRPEPVRRSDLGFVTRNIFESKVNAAFLCGFSCFLVGRCKLDPGLKVTCFQNLNLIDHTVLST